AAGAAVAAGALVAAGAASVGFSGAAVACAAGAAVAAGSFAAGAPPPHAARIGNTSANNSATAPPAPQEIHESRQAPVLSSTGIGGGSEGWGGVGAGGSSPPPFVGESGVFCIWTGGGGGGGGAGAHPRPPNPHPPQPTVKRELPFRNLV